MVINADDFNVSILANVKTQNRRNHQRTKLKYLDIITAFDIETTNIDDLKQAVMYIWQWQIGPEYTIIGRTWEQFGDLYNRIANTIPEGCRLVCYVHNLSFEFQYLKSIIKFRDVMAMDNRKVLRAISGCIEFRCSYLHSNMSLSKYLESMGVNDQKIKGFDYSKKRFSDTVLTDAELLYCINDVKGLEEALRIEMERDGDDLYTIPLTSTGYIRRKAKKCLGGYVRYMRRWLPDLHVMHLLRREFRGGNVHANRWNANRVIYASDNYPINMKDISSSYPTQLLLNLYPCEFFERDPSKFRVSMKYGKACLFVARLTNVRLKNDAWGCPYISKAKCDYIENGKYDNGRVLSADELIAVYNEIDFAILESEYSFKYEILELYVARKQKLPQSFRDLILDEYKAKTMLKGVDDYKYAKAKNRFNSLYGMAVQNPIKPELLYNDTDDIIYTDDGIEIMPGEIYEDYDKSMEEQIKEYHRTGWLPYQIGVWCTSYARLHLERGLHAIPPEAFLYCDTDSIKYVGSYDKAFEALNNEYKHEDLSAVDRNGVRHYLGLFENENRLPIKAFKTMGAKKYCYVDDDGLHLTLAGVDKIKGAHELGTIDNFKTGFLFKKSAGSESIYNDQMQPVQVNYKGHELKISSNLYLHDSTYELGLDYEYYKLLAFLATTDIRYSMHYER